MYPAFDSSTIRFSVSGSPSLTVSVLYSSGSSRLMLLMYHSVVSSFLWRINRMVAIGSCFPVVL